MMKKGQVVGFKRIFRLDMKARLPIDPADAPAA